MTLPLSPGQVAILDAIDRRGRVHVARSGRSRTGPRHVFTGYGDDDLDARSLDALIRKGLIVYVDRDHPLWDWRYMTYVRPPKGLQTKRSVL